MSPADLALLALAGFATSAFTAAVGLGGGMILLSLMLLYWDPVVAIPLHGAVQLVSNASRTAIQRRHVRWSILGRYAIPLVPFGLLGLAWLHAIPVGVTRAAIGVFVLLAVWAPRLLFLGVDPARAHPTRRFLWLGCIAGLLNTTVGATGPLQGPFFRNLGLSRQGVVGSFAAAQTLGHTVKIGLFVAAGFSFAAHVLPLALLAGGVLVGTWAGSRVLERVPERAFDAIYRGALTAIALRLAVWEPWVGG